MTTDVFSYLATVGLRKRSQTVWQTAEILTGWEIAKLGDFCLAVSELLPRPSKRAISPFTFVGNASLADDSVPCANPPCRMRTVDSMARFAALYADKVFLPDAFKDLHSFIESGRCVQTEYLEKACLELAVRVHVLYYIRPLVEDGIVQFIKTIHRTLCASCYEKAIGEVGSEYLKKLSAAKRLLNKRYCEEIDYVVTRIDDSMTLTQTGPEDLVPHGQSFRLLDKVPNSLVGKSASVPFKLTKAQVKTYGLVNIGYIIDDLLRQNYYSIMFGTNYLTQREIDVDIMNRC
jgi:hypothetical protein